MIVFPCQVCQTPLCAEEAQASQLVRCPTCAATLRVPASSPAASPVGAGASRASAQVAGERTYTGGMLNPRSAGRRFGFNCVYCSSRLEATESMSAQEAQCPTCGKMITIPLLDRYGRQIDPNTNQIIKQDPHPVHAYAAAGDRAPRIERLKDGAQVIRCPRCGTCSPITSNNCRSCGMPFTMEGTTVEGSGTSNGFCVASLVLGIIGIPGSCTLILPILALVFGIIGYSQVSRGGENEKGGKGMAIAGMACGAAGALIGVLWRINL